MNMATTGGPTIIEHDELDLTLAKMVWDATDGLWFVDVLYDEHSRQPVVRFRTLQQWVADADAGFAIPWQEVEELGIRTIDDFVANGLRSDRLQLAPRVRASSESNCYIYLDRIHPYNMLVSTR